MNVAGSGSNPFTPRHTQGWSPFTESEHGEQPAASAQPPASEIELSGLGQAHQPPQPQISAAAPHHGPPAVPPDFAAGSSSRRSYLPSLRTLLYGGLLVSSNLLTSALTEMWVTTHDNRRLTDLSYAAGAHISQLESELHACRKAANSSAPAPAPGFFGDEMMPAPPPHNVTTQILPEGIADGGGLQAETGIADEATDALDRLSHIPFMRRAIEELAGHVFSPVCIVPPGEGLELENDCRPVLFDPIAGDVSQLPAHDGRPNLCASTPPLRKFAANLLHARDAIREPVLTEMLEQLPHPNLGNMNEYRINTILGKLPQMGGPVELLGEPVPVLSVNDTELCTPNPDNVPEVLKRFSRRYTFAIGPERQAPFEHSSYGDFTGSTSPGEYPLSKELMDEYHALQNAGLNLQEHIGQIRDDGKQPNGTDWLHTHELEEGGLLLALAANIGSSNAGNVTRDFFPPGFLNRALEAASDAPAPAPTVFAGDPQGAPGHGRRLLQSDGSATAHRPIEFALRA